MLEDGTVRIFFGAFENREMRYKLVPILARPGIETRKQDLVHFEHRPVVDRFFPGKKLKRLFQAQLKRKMLGFFDFGRVFELEGVLKISSGFKITEGIKHHALSCFFKRRFS